MLQCAACGTQNPEEFKFCENCGERIDQLSCPACSHLNLRDMKFCEECGAQLDIVACRSCSHENPREFKFCEECGQTLVEEVPQVAPAPGPVKAPDSEEVQSVVAASQEKFVSRTTSPPSSSTKMPPISRRKPRIPKATIVVRQLPRKNSVWAFLLKTVLRAFVGSVLGFLVGKLGGWLLNGLFELFSA